MEKEIVFEIGENTFIDLYINRIYCGIVWCDYLRIVHKEFLSGNTSFVTVKSEDVTVFVSSSLSGAFYCEDDGVLFIET